MKEYQIGKVKRSQSERAIFCMTPNTKHFEKESKKLLLPEFLGVRQGGMSRWRISEQ